MRQGSSERTRRVGNERRNTIHWGSLLRSLERFYTGGTWRRPVLRERGVDPFNVLVSTVLSHRSHDETTLPAFAALIARYPSPKALARADPREVEWLIRPVGLSYGKARGLVSLARAIELSHGGQVPNDYASLIRLPFVGPKTANAVLVFGWQHPAIPVDSNIHRVVNRLGVVSTDSPQETTTALESAVPRRYWSELNPTLVQHGQNLCGPVIPKCERCPIRNCCDTGAIRQHKTYLRDGRAPLPARQSTSRSMRANRGRATGPELRLREECRAQRISGGRYNWAGAPGRPDVAFPHARVAVFVHGCFWHRCPTCRLPLPKSHPTFWRAKFQRNRRRDARRLLHLRELGWRSVVIWECELKTDRSACARRIRTALYAAAKKSAAAQMRHV
jgi:DNA mismatch endonuclease Vsr